MNEEDKLLRDLKFYKYLVEEIYNNTKIECPTNASNVVTYWFTLYFDDKNNHTSYRCGDGVCDLFKKFNPTRRICEFLINGGLKPHEIPTLLNMLKIKWEKELNIIFDCTQYAIPWEYTYHNQTPNWALINEEEKYINESYTKYKWEN
tara:strand:- start:372 stop:815 length:444 start_codon:yes stop_codon:yes gene_type:complete